MEGGRWPKRRMWLFIFMGCKGMKNPSFWERGWHPAGHLGTFFFSTSAFVFCNLSPLVMWVVEAIFLKMWTFLSIQIRFKTKSWSWRSMNNNDVDVKYVEIKLSFSKFNVSSSTWAITIFVWNMFRNLKILVTVLWFLVIFGTELG